MSDKLGKNNESESNGGGLKKVDEIVELASDVLQALDNVGQDGITASKGDQGTGIHVEEQGEGPRSVEKRGTPSMALTTGAMDVNLIGHGSTMEMVEPMLERGDSREGSLRKAVEVFTVPRISSSECKD